MRSKMRNKKQQKEKDKILGLVDYFFEKENKKNDF